MKWANFFRGFLIAATLMGCGNSSTDKPPVKLFETERQALEKAKALEQQQQQRPEQVELFFNRQRP